MTILELPLFPFFLIETLMKSDLGPRPSPPSPFFYFQLKLNLKTFLPPRYAIKTDIQEVQRDFFSSLPLVVPFPAHSPTNLPLPLRPRHDNEIVLIATPFSFSSPRPPRFEIVLVFFFPRRI